MNDNSNDLEGGCMCGAVRYRAANPPTYAGMCHCDDCRRAVGGAYVPWFGAAPENFEVTKGKITEYESSPGTRRGFCGKCGSSLTFGGDGWNDISITIASLDDPNAITPVSQVFLRERLHWISIDEGMRNHDGFPEEIKEKR